MDNVNISYVDDYREPLLNLNFTRHNRPTWEYYRNITHYIIQTAY